MNRRLLTILTFAFAIAGVCSFLVYRIVGSRVATSKREATVAIVAASDDIKLGSILTAANLKTVEVAGALPKGAITDAKQAIGRGVTTDIIQGEPILEGRLAAKGAGGGLAATIKPGMRACAVKVDDVVGVAGFVSPGMRVDVLVSGDPPGPPDPSRGTLVKTLLQNIEVLSAGADIQKDVEGKPTTAKVVNLLVSPEQAELLSLATSQSHIQLVLRNPLDTEVAEVKGSTVANLYGHEVVQEAHAEVAPRAEVTRPVRRAGTVVEVYNGGVRSQQQFGGTPEVQQ